MLLRPKEKDNPDHERLVSTTTARRTGRVVEMVVVNEVCWGGTQGMGSRC